MQYTIKDLFKKELYETNPHLKMAFKYVLFYWGAVLLVLFPNIPCIISENTTVCLQNLSVGYSMAVILFPSFVFFADLNLPYPILLFLSLTIQSILWMAVGMINGLVKPKDKN